MKRLLLWLSNHSENISEPGLTVSQIEAFLKNAWPRLQGFQDSALTKERARISACLGELGWLRDNREQREPLEKRGKSDSEKALDWLREHEDGKVIRRGVVAVGCGWNLAALEAGGYAQKISPIMEGLMRHVEVQRRACLRAFSSPLTQKDQWLERLDISILFSRWARGQKDLRFLNAVFKLNDFWFPKWKNHRDDFIFSRGCLSLAEQELSAKELLK